MPSPVERVDYLKWRRGLVWKQGQHLSIVGPTGSGKTRLMRHLVEMRSWALWLASKPKDPELDAMVRQGWHRSRDGELDPLDGSRVLVWPNWPRDEMNPDHAPYWHRALNSAWSQRGWCVAIDEVSFAADMGLSPYLAQIWKQGRTLSLSMLTATQRPAWVPRTMWSEASHLIFFRMNDQRDLDTVAQASSVSRSQVRDAALQLRQFEFIHASMGKLVIVSPAMFSTSTNRRNSR